MFSYSKGLYGVYFPDNSSAFTASAMGLTIGLAFGAFASTFMCVQIKVYLFIVIIITSLICYISLYYKHSNLTTQNNNLSENPTQVEKF